MPITAKNIIIAIFIALIWISLVTLAAFTNEFESMQFSPCRFETTGKIVILVIAVYLFDILLEVIMTSLLEAIKVYCVGILILVISSLLVLYFTMAHSVSSIVTILIISVFMGALKGICVFQTIKKRSSEDTIW